MAMSQPQQKKRTSEAGGSPVLISPTGSAETKLHIQLEVASDLTRLATIMICPLIVGLPVFAFAACGLSSDSYLIKNLTGLIVLLAYVSLLLSPFAFIAGSVGTLGFLTAKADPRSPPTNLGNCRWLVAWWSTFSLCAVSVACICLQIAIAYHEASQIRTG